MCYFQSASYLDGKTIRCGTKDTKEVKINEECDHGIACPADTVEECMAVINALPLATFTLFALAVLG